MHDVTFDKAEEMFVSYCKSRNLSHNTITWYQFRLLAIRRYLSEKHPGITPNEITISQLRALIGHLIQTVGPKTVNHTVTAIKKFFSFLYEEGFITHNPGTRLEKVKAPRVLIKPFTEEQVRLLLAQPNKDRFSGIRDYTLTLLLLDTGLRISEALGLTLEDIDWSNHTVKVMGKGSLERIVPFGRQVASALMDYLKRRGELECNSLFVGELGGPLSKRVAQDNMHEYGNSAGITGVRVSPHTCRHFAAINYLRNGGSVFHLQKLLGHSSLEICKIYLNLANDDMQQAHRLYSPLDNMLVGAKAPAAQVKKTRLR